MSAACSSGKKVVDGGFETTSVRNSGAIVILSSGPAANGNSWVVTGTVSTTMGSTTYALRATAICMTTL